MTDQYDVIIIGSGAGGGTLAHRLAPSGKKILILERGDFLPREPENWDAQAVFVDNRYVSPDTWYDKDGRPFQPQVHYFVGGATKFYGAALYRLRERDFADVKHYDGLSPAWPITYDEMEPYYSEAETLYQVHGARGEDPTEPPASSPYPFPPVSHEPRIQHLFDDLRAVGLHPFHAPAGIMLDEAHPEQSACIRCATCDGFPCLVNAKSDADVWPCGRRCDTRTSRWSGAQRCGGC
jgi:choline dehydrogenase-like flavoprotein